MSCHSRSVPGSQFSTEASDCNSAVTSVLSSAGSLTPTDLVLTSGYYGAAIAAKMVGQG